MDIRACTTQDFDAVLVLVKQLWPAKPLNRKRLKPLYECTLASSQQEYICAEEKGKVVGLCSLTTKSSLWHEGHVAYVNEIVVDEAHRRAGIGTALLERMVRLAKARGCAWLELDSALHREEAHKFYEANGLQKRAYLFSKALRDEGVA